MAGTTVGITGMTCGCCVNEVRAGVEGIDGVTEIEIDPDGAAPTSCGSGGRSAVAGAAGCDATVRAV